MKGRVLIVHDSGFTRMQMERTLTNSGFEVYTSEYGRKVINNDFDDKVNLEHIDVVFLDLYLPDIDGLEVLRTLNRKYPDLPIIFVSNEKIKEKIIKIIDMGAKDYLVKPIDRELLVSRVEKQMNAKKTRQEKQRGQVQQSAAIENKNERQPPSQNTFNREKVRLEKQLLEEVDRAIRTDSPLTILKVTGPLSDLGEFQQAAEMALRRIDSVFNLEDYVVLLLPATEVEGVRVVHEKILNVFKELTGTQKDEALNFMEFFFPRQEYQEDIERYRIEEICNDLLKKIDI